MLCGISHPFGRLSPARRQVTHALLTRLPLYSQPEGYFRVRLACIRHAASVDSEPGSNSQVKDVASGHSHEWPSDNFNAKAFYGSSLFSLFVRLILDECASSSYLVFKEPAPNQVSPVAAPPLHGFPPSGEPYEVITDVDAVNGAVAVSCHARAFGMALATPHLTTQHLPKRPSRSAGAAHLFIPSSVLDTPAAPYACQPVGQMRQRLATRGNFGQSHARRRYEHFPARSTGSPRYSIRRDQP